MSDVILDNHWHFLCLLWDNEIGITFYDQGLVIDKCEKQSTSILPGGNFLIGATKQDQNGSYVFSNRFVGTLSCLNIWSAKLFYKSIFIMTSGAMNVNGDVLAWRNVLQLIVNNVTVVPNTIVYYPGKTKGFSVDSQTEKLRCINVEPTFNLLQWGQCFLVVYVYTAYSCR